MATKAQRNWNDLETTGKQRQKNEHDERRLKVLRLDLHTIQAQINMLEHELDADPCLSTEGITTIQSLVETLKQQLEGVRVQIKALKGSTPT